MSKLIPNENTWVGFEVVTTFPTDLTAPSAADIASAENLTPFVVSINASATGNTVPTPALDSLFETSVPGTSAATFQGDFYRDDEDDAAWDALQRGVKGVFYISRFGGKGTDKMPILADKCEVWPVIITSRSAAALSSNTAQTFTVTAAVTVEPAENATVAA
jgi:hypothetical protein